MDFSFVLHFSCGTLCKAESDIQVHWRCFFLINFLLSVTSVCLHSAAYWKNTVQMHFFDLHFVFWYIQSPQKSRKQKQCLKIFMLCRFGRFFKGDPTYGLIIIIIIILIIIIIIYVFNTRWRKYAMKLECASTVCRTDFLNIKHLQL